MNHIKKFIIILLTLNLNCNKKFELPDVVIPQEPPAKLQKKKKLPSKWEENVNINVKNNISISKILKSIANNLNLKIMLHAKDANINYEATNKPFIETLLDICEINDWKIMLDGDNAKITEDSPYMQSYDIHFLNAERKTKGEIAFTGNMGTGETSNSGSSGHITTSTNSDYFADLKKNLEVLCSTEAENIKFTINAQAGILTIIAKQKFHKAIYKYILMLAKNIRKQVLLEAKIYEIELYHQFETGIDWAKIASHSLGLNLPNIISSSVEGLFTMNLKTPVAGTDNDGALIKFLNVFGKVQAVSHPRLIISNNHTALFKVIENAVYFKLKNTMIGDNNNQKLRPVTQFHSEIQTVPVGMIMLVQVSINANDDITIALKPTISEIGKEVDDPAALLMSAQAKLSPINSKIPVMKTRELDTIFTVQSNELIVIGGLIYTKKKDESKGIGAGKIIDFLTGSKNLFSEKKEIVIFITATIHENAENSSEKYMFLQ